MLGRSKAAIVAMLLDSADTTAWPVMPVIRAVVMVFSRSACYQPQLAGRVAVGAALGGRA